MLISKHNDDPFLGYFDMEKTQELIAKRYYRQMLPKDIKAYVKSYNLCLALKIVCQKPYSDFQSLSISTHL